MTKKWLSVMGVVLWAVLLLPAITTAAAEPIGVTYQTWDFEQQTLPFGILPSQAINPYGTPVAMIQDLSGTRLLGWGNGAWYGPEFKIIIDVPNQQIANPAKFLTVDLRYHGLVEFSWAADIVTGRPFTLLNQTHGVADGWKTLSQLYMFIPNPREEIVVIGLKGLPIPGAVPMALLDSITIRTICVPEPGTMALLALGFGLIARKKIARIGVCRQLSESEKRF